MDSSRIGNQTLADMSAISVSDPSILTIMSKQVRFLNRRVAQLEKENQARRQNEFIVYSLGLMYLAFKGFGIIRKFL
jgi:hypothetical protein